MYDEMTYRLALQFQPNWGGVTIKKLLQYYGSATDIFTKFNKVGRRQAHVPNSHLPPPTLTSDMLLTIEKEREKMAREQIQYCFYSDPNYPQRLKNCNDAPVAFFYKGSGDFNYPRAVAIVGTRNASAYGKSVVQKLLEEMASAGVVVVSGLASGIDSVAHEQSLANQLKTVAVMGSGFGTIYPSSNASLARRIVAEGGTLISEYLYATRPDRQNFPKRNRIIAGLSDAVIVAETATKGGSMITAYIAQSYNRDVFAVPGNLFNKMQEGCHELIRKNVAALVHSGQNVIEMMNWDVDAKTSKQPELFVDLSYDEEQVVDFIQRHRSASIDEIVDYCPHLSVSKTTALLLSLEFKGVIQCKPGKVYALS